MVACILCNVAHAFVPHSAPSKPASTICTASKDLSFDRREFVNSCVIAAGVVAAAAPAAFAAPVESLTEYSDPRYGFQFSVPSAWNKVSDTVMQYASAHCIRRVLHLQARL